MKLIICLMIAVVLSGCGVSNRVKLPENTPVPVEKIEINNDKDGDGVLDLDDIVEGARNEVSNGSQYKDAYYGGGYPPDSEGVCTDVIWRAFKNAGYNLKNMIDEDIAENKSAYPGVAGVPDPNIDFRRVKNQIAFFKRHAQVLTTELKTGDLEELKKWQGGDIVSIDIPEHIGILSDKRNENGVPYVIHNMGPVPREEDCLELWNGRITGHFRFPKE